MTFLKALVASASEPLTLDELNELKKHMTVLCNQKIKAQQNPTKKKKGGLLAMALSMFLINSY